MPPDDVDALADALRRVLGDRTYAEALGAAGRERALAEFSDELYADRFEQLYREIV